MSKSLDKKVADERKRIQAKILNLVKEDEDLATWEESRKPKPFDVAGKPVLEKTGEEKPLNFKEAMAKAAEHVGEK